MTTCAKPTPFDTIVALWAGDLTAEETAAVEGHLFACDECAATSDRLGKLVVGLRAGIPPVISHAHRDRLVDSGKRIRVTPVEPGIQAHAHFTKDVDLLVHVLKGDLSRADRVDVELVTPEGITRHTFELVPFDARAGEVLIACQRHYEHIFPGGDPLFRVLAVEQGRRRTVGEYLVVHHWE